jgi:ankyrin repeat protein
MKMSPIHGITLLYTILDCINSNEDEAAKLLLDSGANVNSRNERQLTPLMITAVKGHVSTMKILMDHPDIDLTVQDSNGNTPLHMAVLGQKNEAVALLIEARTDLLQLVNFRLFTPVHEAARIGFLPAVEQFISKDPDCVNRKKDDGFTPLHLASLNHHLDVLTTIVETDICDIDSRTINNSTALHVAMQQDNASIIERLIGFGASLNVQDANGDTPLHLVIMRKSTNAIVTKDTPQLKKLQDEISTEDIPVDGFILMSYFLLQQGANLYVLNNKGVPPLSLCPPDDAGSLTNFFDNKSNYPSTFHGSLRMAKPSPASLPLSMKPMDTPKTTPTKSLTEETTPTQPIAPPISSSSYDECYLCDDPVDIQLVPCGHAVLCREHGQRAKKCPECKAAVTGTKDLDPPVPICTYCEDEPATVTLIPCKHQICPGCCRRMKKCPDCKQPIHSKLGLS